MSILGSDFLAGMFGLYDMKDIATIERKNNIPILKINKELFFEDEYEEEKCMLRIFKLVADAIRLHNLETNIWVCDIWEDENEDKLIYTCNGYTKNDFKKSVYYTTYKKYKKYIETDDVIILTTRKYLTKDMYNKILTKQFEDICKELER